MIILLLLRGSILEITIQNAVYAEVLMTNLVFVTQDKLNRKIMKNLWIEYEFGKTHPPKPGRYLVYRKKCDKWHQEVWNGTGWASNNNDITHYIDVLTP